MPYCLAQQVVILLLTMGVRYRVLLGGVSGLLINATPLSKMPAFINGGLNNLLGQSSNLSVNEYNNNGIENFSVMKVYDDIDGAQAIGSAVANVAATKVQGSIQKDFYPGMYVNTNNFVGELVKGTTAGVIIGTTESIIEKDNVTNLINKIKGE